MKNSGIGGQAVIEGVMMKNGDKYAVAVRKPDGDIVVELKDCRDEDERSPFAKLPIIRGIVSFVESLTIGMNAMSVASKYYIDDEEEPDYMKKLDKATHGKAESIFNGFTVIISVALALVIFVLLPLLLSNLAGIYVKNGVLLGLIEGVIRVLIFIIYILLISRIQDIKRLFMYHGAEHKVISCIENGKALNVKNARGSSRVHKRCGTSFVLNVMLISILFFMVIRVDNIFLKMGLRLLLIPVIAGVSYEFIKLAGRSESKIVNFLSKPGLLMQRLTTKEPDDSMLEVAIKSVEAVFDWKSFVNEYNGKGRKKGKYELGASPAEQKEKGKNKKNKAAEAANEKQLEVARETAENANASANAAVNVVAETVAATAATTATATTAEAAQTTESTAKTDNTANTENTANNGPIEVDISQFFDIQLPDIDENAKPKKFKFKKDDEKSSVSVVSTSQNESDDILAALDFMFDYEGEKTEIEISDDPNVVVTGSKDKLQEPDDFSDK